MENKSSSHVLINETLRLCLTLLSWRFLSVARSSWGAIAPAEPSPLNVSSIFPTSTSMAFLNADREPKSPTPETGAESHFSLALMARRSERWGRRLDQAAGEAMSSGLQMLHLKR